MACTAGSRHGWRIRIEVSLSPTRLPPPLCHRSKSFDAKFEEYSIVNAMLPTRYLPSFKGNSYEKRATAFVAELFPGTPMAADYDQLLDKVRERRGRARR